MLSRYTRNVLLALLIVVLSAGGNLGVRAQDATPEGGFGPSADTTSALLVTAFSTPFVVSASDGMDHIEYDLMFTNAFISPVTIDRIEVLDPSGTVLLDLQGEAVVAETLQILPSEFTNVVPYGGALATVLDVVVPVGTAPAELTHRISYSLEPDTLAPALIGARTIEGPTVTVDPRPAIVVSAPFDSGLWLNADGCCVARNHRTFITSRGGLQLVKPETFAIDWVGFDGTNAATGDGTKNSDYVGYGANIVSATEGIVIDVRDGHPEPEASEAPILTGPEDYSGNSVVVQVEEGVYAFYAHLQPGSVAVEIGDRVEVGQLLGALGNSGNSTAPHLHFELMDGPNVLIANSLPFVIDTYELVGDTDMEFVDGKPTVSTITGTPGPQIDTLPLHATVIEIP
jgi:murein DD-endopeptidase MepM/ murein hydrolase activator NlpD